MRLLVFFLLILTGNAFSQTYGEKDFYLLDSLDLGKLTDADRKLIDSSLFIFENCGSDTCRSSAINAIVEGSWDNNVWPRYNLWNHQFLKDRLKEKMSEEERVFLRRIYAVTLNNIAYTYSDNGNSIEAIEVYEQCMSIQKSVNDSLGVATTLNNIGYVHDNLGNIEEALNFYSRSLKIREAAKDSIGMAKSLNNIATIFHEQGELDKALKIMKKTLQVEQSMNNNWEVAIRYSNIGSLFESKGIQDSALYYYRKSLEAYKMVGSIQGEALSQNKIGRVYFLEGEVNEALDYYFKSLSLNEEVDDKDATALVLLNIGEAYFTKNNLSSANSYALQGYELAAENGFPRTIGKAAITLSKIYKKSGNFNKSLEMYELHIAMRDSIENEKNTRASIQQEIRYKYEAKAAKDSVITAEKDKVVAAELASKEAESKRHKLEVASQKKQKLYLYGFLALVALFAVFIFSRFRIARKQKNIIDKQHEQLEETHREISDSIQYAQYLQQAILPSRQELKQELGNGFVFFLPKNVVSGDFYWLQKSGDTTLFAVADCTGHGVPGAMVSIVCSNALNRAVKEFGHVLPSETLNKTRDIVIETFARSGKRIGDGMDIALCTLNGKTLKYAGAHNPLWIIRKNALEIEEIKANKQPIGVFDNPKPYTMHTIELNEGDSFYIFSDGFADQFGGVKGKKYKPANFKKLLLSVQEEPMEKQRSLIEEAFRQWQGDHEQLDDVCVIGVKV